MSVNDFRQVDGSFYLCLPEVTWRCRTRAASVHLRDPAARRTLAACALVRPHARVHGRRRTFRLRSRRRGEREGGVVGKRHFHHQQATHATHTKSGGAGARRCTERWSREYFHIRFITQCTSGIEGTKLKIYSTASPSTASPSSCSRSLKRAESGAISNGSFGRSRKSTCIMSNAMHVRSSM